MGNPSRYTGNEIYAKIQYLHDLLSKLVLFLEEL